MDDKVWVNEKWERQSDGAIKYTLLMDGKEQSDTFSKAEIAHEDEYYSKYDNKPY